MSTDLSAFHLYTFRNWRLKYIELLGRGIKEVKSIHNVDVVLIFDFEG